MCSNHLTPIDYLYSFEHLKVLRQTCIPIDNSPFLVISGLPCNPSSSHNTWFQTLEDLPEPNVQYSMYIYLTICYLNDEEKIPNTLHLQGRKIGHELILSPSQGVCNWILESGSRSAQTQAAYFSFPKRYLIAISSTYF
jgi:hypothetical protein